jgi:hypothetical protein
MDTETMTIAEFLALPNKKRVGIYTNISVQHKIAMLPLL